MGSVDPAVFSLRLSWSLRDGRSEAAGDLGSVSVTQREARLWAPYREAFSTFRDLLEALRLTWTPSRAREFPRKAVVKKLAEEKKHSPLMRNNLSAFIKQTENVPLKSFQSVSTNKTRLTESGWQPGLRLQVKRLRLVSCPGTCRAGAPPAGPPGRGPRGSTPFPPQQRDSRLQCGRGANRWHKRPGLARGSPSVPPGCLCGPEGLRARAPRRAGPGPAGRSAPGPSSGRRGQERLRPAPSAGRPWTRRRMWRCSPSA
uniref:Uncharacterized protein n=1 Tax=Rangifer tarandus platyrhynchus TaxID=3082113 RepID=A0ACB0E6M3_RANTA|nr:unnamed protein product [Rangifer tarandus platyrhynchus]